MVRPPAVLRRSREPTTRSRQAASPANPARGATRLKSQKREPATSERRLPVSAGTQRLPWAPISRDGASDRRVPSLASRNKIRAAASLFSRLETGGSQPRNWALNSSSSWRNPPKHQLRFNCLLGRPRKPNRHPYILPRRKALPDRAQLASKRGRGSGGSENPDKSELRRGPY
jgi:hypothetical protein